MRYATNAHDAYIQLPSQKLIKISEDNPSTKAGNELLSHYLNKKIEHVFISKKDFAELVTKYKQNFLNYKNPEEKIKIAGHVFHLSLTSLESLGLHEDQIHQTNELLEDTIKDLSKNNSFFNNFKEVYTNEGYIVGHSMLLIYLASSIVKSSQLNFEQTMKKITLAAVIHDLSLVDDDIAQRELDLEPIPKGNLRHKLLNHGLDSTKYISSSNEISEDSKKILLEHHEKPDGSGYPKGLTGTNTSQLSCVFNIAHDLAIVLINNNYNHLKVAEYLMKKKDYYSNGNYLRYYQIALSVFT